MGLIFFIGLFGSFSEVNVFAVKKVEKNAFDVLHNSKKRILLQRL